MKRRQFLKLGAVGSGVFALGAVGRLSGAPAAAQVSAVPTVDRLVMTNAVDNIYDLFAKAGRLDVVTVQRTPLGSGAGAALIAEHGLAYHLESLRGGERREVLLDFTLTDLALANNYRILKIDPARADALIISHGHADHYGALPGLARAQQGKLKPGLMLYAGGEDTFCQRFVVTPDGQRRDSGQLDRTALEGSGLNVTLAKQPAVVAGQAFTSGQIARLTDFEKPPAAARLMAGPMDSGCSPTHFGVSQVQAQAGELVPDNFQGEHATAYHVKDRGLVVITSCGHAGVINSVRQVQKATGIDKVHAVVGGFHLAPAPDEVVAKTVDAFKQINPDYIIPSHCTGLNTIIAIHRAMPQKLIMPSTGTRVIFGA
jgi:7,8-dihydropterin-6-yl-methyl-4-(beta-D-ribofuranosyl)aminobenzene 5'-phosphate synthase